MSFLFKALQSKGLEYFHKNLYSKLKSGLAIMKHENRSISNEKRSPKLFKIGLKYRKGIIDDYEDNGNEKVNAHNLINRIQSNISTFKKFQNSNIIMNSIIQNFDHYNYNEKNQENPNMITFCPNFTFGSMLRH